MQRSIRFLGLTKKYEENDMPKGVGEQAGNPFAKKAKQGVGEQAAKPKAAKKKKR
jgi:hypothetical protein